MIFSGTCGINSLENRKGGGPRSVLIRLLDSVIPSMECWNPGRHGCLRTHPAHLDAGMTNTPFSCSVGERNLMKHFVALTIHLGIRCPFTLRPAQSERTAFWWRDRLNRAAMWCRRLYKLPPSLHSGRDSAKTLLFSNGYSQPVPTTSSVR
jgi:hypothetical protein